MKKKFSIDASKNNHEKKIDQNLNELEIESSRGSDDPFKALQRRLILRKSYENIIRDYLALYQEKRGSEYIGLKILNAMDLIRARDIAVQNIRIAPIGELKRQNWQEKFSFHTASILNSQLRFPNSIRTFRNSGTSNASHFHGQPYTQSLELNPVNYNGGSTLNLSNVLIVHFCFVDDNLLVALDANVELFFYSTRSAVDSGYFQWNAFRDYAYDFKYHELDPRRLIDGFIIIKNVRSKLIKLANYFHLTIEEHISKYKSVPEPKFFEECIKKIENLLGFKQIFGKIQNWAENNNRSLKDICLILAPDEALYTLPLSFLGGVDGYPLITKVGGVTNVLSLIALKWSVSDYHAITVPNQSKKSPRCVFFGSDALEEQPLDLSKEIQEVSKNFKKENCLIFADYPNRIDFLSNYSAGDICWFSGHGEFNLNHGINVEGNILPFPITGILFSDGLITNLDLIATSNWNFKMLWLTVMNCCLLSKMFIMGPNPLGFISSLYSVGSISTVAALWPVADKASIIFAKYLSEEIISNFPKHDFPRARAVASALTKAIEQNPKNLWLFAPYTLWGLP